MNLKYRLYISITEQLESGLTQEITRGLNVSDGNEIHTTINDMIDSLEKAKKPL